MKEFLMEMHAHTSEVSPCSSVCAKKVIEAYRYEGYNGIVITNHMSSRVYRDISKASWKRKVEYFLSGYQAAKDAAGQNFTVLLGMEIAFNAGINDYLVYGFDENFLYNNGNLMELGFKKFKALADQYNLMIFHAHPFRKGMCIQDYHLLDGIEVYNGNSSHNSNNDFALAWADKYGLKKISGSDFHNYFGMRPGGILFSQPINSNAELLEALRKNNYRLR